MKWYICRECGSTSEKEKECPSCGKPMEEVEVSRGFEGSIPFLLAGIAAVLLILSFLTDRFILIWLTFPIIGAGLIYDHLYQKHVKNALKDTIK
ncbi:MAG: hypothetical protein KGY66_01195 [Candidatus Thermoplasmatota archaeon]|nr:hypothetical protein [Candidatus Thermoplasmatota archaeon]MBS3789515.1 hypothetical protein [Candidatus Thermoplasmatota archaeon]